MAEKYELAYEDYKNGMKYKDIAEKYNVSIGTVNSWKTRYKWQKSMHRKKENLCIENRKSMHTKGIDGSVEKAIIDTVEENEELTDKQRLFCICYLKNFNATQAAINAGYSPETATEIGYENLIKPHIRKEIKKLKAVKAESILLSEDDVLERYMKIAFSDMTDFVEFGQVTEKIYSDDGDEIGEREVNAVNFKDSTVVDGGLISEISQGKNGSKIKLEDRQKALAWLADYFMMNPMNKHKVDYDEKLLGYKQKDSDLKEREFELKKSIDDKNNSLDSTKSDTIDELSTEELRKLAERNPI